MYSILASGNSASGSQAQGLGMFGMIVWLVILFAFMYFLMIRPQKKQQKKDDEMRDSLAVGDEVTTIGGIIGKVVSIKEETFVLETTKERTKIRFLKAAVRTIDVKAADVTASILQSKEAENKAAETAEEPAADADKSGKDADKSGKKEK